ncbi:MULTISPECIES: NUDIX domain-containing protein [unclassified Leptolyngbya]|uniref:NUDIX domain-containing protein n=1 Tax=unclassified Leptolyngbya TaxID=2650499 RepID=UPI001689D068|nr:MULTISPECIES: NUDIX domain-containing protein [unclassified Leptolyngbya]MBD1911080.1 NUDIX domain-containing protein [Leptolyngbya sp. FACHB-8]MBD2152918.1 NUDIX domain-containing protein [Leptolyngbya sp. FACHB-16]
MVRKSAGLLMYRWYEGDIQVLLVHHGGPFWVKKELAAWSIPKGEYLDDETPFDAAQREFREETGFVATGQFLELTEVKQASGKRVKAWAFEGNWDPSQLHSNTFTIEYPPHSGKLQTFPEVDRAAWFDLDEARRRIVKGQVPLLDELMLLLSSQPNYSS